MNRALCFIFGAIAGTALGYYIARQRCEEEIESVKEAFREDSEREESSVDHNEADENPDREPIDSSIRPAVKEAIDYMNTVRKAGYTAAPDPTDEDEVSDIPYEITPTNIWHFLTRPSRSITAGLERPLFEAISLSAKR